MDRFNFSRSSFDIVIVGGGISGACVAYEGASRGLSVLLIEKADFGGATSAATSKLIHGGLRYLNTLEFGLVRESLHERRILEDIAPNLVVPLPFLIPNYKGKTTNRWVLKAGMVLYDLLSFDRRWARHKSGKIPGHRTVSRSEVLKIAPILPEDRLTGGFVYFDCQSIFPERLTLAFVKSAAKSGASVLNYAEVCGFQKDSGRITGVEVLDHITGKRHSVQAGLVINSGGPWAGRLLDRAMGTPSPHTMRMSEGIHLLLPDLGLDHALVLSTAGHRHFFLIPWRGRTLAGTTDREYTGSPDEYRVTEKSVDEFIEEINSAFGRALVDRTKVLRAYGGLRPLTDTQTEGTYSSSRKYEIFDGAKEGLPGLITVEGGKYTTSRHLAETVLAVVARNLGRKLAPSRTEDLPLAGSEIPSLTEFFASAPGRIKDFPEKTVQFLARNYGTEMDAVLDIARQDDRLKKPIGEDGEILAQAVYGVQVEMAQNLEDVILRRMSVGAFGSMNNADLLLIAETMAGLLNRPPGWAGEQCERMKAALMLPWDRRGK